MPADFDAFRASPVPMWVFDLDDLRILRANPAAAEMYGYSCDELESMTILDLRPADARAALAAYVRVPPDQRPQGLVWTHLHRDGTRMHVQVRSSDVLFEGRTARLVVARDISELERAQQRVHLLAQAMSDGAYDWDVPGGEVWFSDSFARVFGYTGEALPTTIDGWAGLIHPHDRVRVDASLSTAIDGEDTYWVEEYCFQRGDGTYTDVLVFHVPKAGSGQQVQLIAAESVLTAVAAQ